jgi:S-adenosylmethionine:tRNA ribosyltransferase-isomerase
LGEKALYGDLSECFVAASDAYSDRYGKITMRESLIALREYAIKQGGVVRGETQIFIVPGFKFRLVQWMITNFHQPKSTLLMLISAFIGEGWKDVYGHAIGGDYRFLSYGDGSLLTCKINISY